MEKIQKHTTTTNTTNNVSGLQTTLISKKVSQDKIKIADLCFRKNVQQPPTQQMISIKSQPYITQAQENIMLCQKTKIDERRMTQLDSDNTQENIIQKNQSLQEGGHNKTLQINDYLNNGVNIVKVLKTNNTPKSNNINSININNNTNLQIPSKSLKMPTKSNSISQQYLQQPNLNQSQNKKTHLKYQTLLIDKTRRNGIELEENKQITIACSNSPQSRNAVSQIAMDILKSQNQTQSQRDSRQQHKKLGDKKKQSMGQPENNNNVYYDDLNNSKKQRNRSEQIIPKQLFTLTQQNQFFTLNTNSNNNHHHQNNDNSLKRNSDISQDKQKTHQNQIELKDNNNQEIQGNIKINPQYKLNHQSQVNHNNNQINNEHDKYSSDRTMSNNINERKEQKKKPNENKDRDQSDNDRNYHISSKYKLKESDIQKFSLLFLQQQSSKHNSTLTNKHSLSGNISSNQKNIHKNQEQSSDNNKQNQLCGNKSTTTTQQSKKSQSKSKSPSHILVQNNHRIAQQNTIPQQQQQQQQQQLVQSERQINGNEHSPLQGQYGRTNNKQNQNQLNVFPTSQLKQNNYYHQETQQKQRMVSLNSRQSILNSNNIIQEDEDNLAQQQLSSLFLRSSSSSKEPNRRYEKQPLDKKSEIDKKIKDYLESKQQNSSQDLSSRQLILTTPTGITISTQNQTITAQNSKSINSNILLNSNLTHSNHLLSSNLMNSNLQQNLSKENSRQPTQNSNQYFLGNQMPLNESQVHFIAENDSCNTYDYNSQKKNDYLSSDQHQQSKTNNNNNSNNTNNNNLNQNNNTPHRQQKGQAKVSANCQIITPSTCDGKQHITLVSPMISNFVISPSSKVINLSPKPFLTTDNEELDIQDYCNYHTDEDMIITLSENTNTEQSEDIPNTISKQNKLSDEKEKKQQDIIHVQDKRNNIQEQQQQLIPQSNKQEQINNKLESRLGALEIEMSSIIQRCVNLEVQNNSLSQNIETVTVEKEIILKENQKFKQKIEELTIVNKQQEQTISILIGKITQQRGSDLSQNISQFKTNRNQTDYSHYNLNENSTSELSCYPTTENASTLSQTTKGIQHSEAFSTNRGQYQQQQQQQQPLTAQNNLKAKKDINQYFSNMINNSQSKQLLPQTFQGYLSQKNLQNIMANSQNQQQTNNSISQNDSSNSKYLFSQSARNQQQQQQQPQKKQFLHQNSSQIQSHLHQQQQQQLQQQPNSVYHLSNVNFEDEQTQTSSYRNDYYLSSRHGISNISKQ